MADISIDVPNAHVVLEKFVSRCFDAGFMSRAVKEKVSARYEWQCMIALCATSGFIRAQQMNR